MTEPEGTEESRGSGTEAYKSFWTPTVSEDAWPSAEELSLIEQLRQAFHEELAQREAQGTLHSCFFGNLALTRILRSTAGRLELAIEWLKRFLVNMHEYSVDEIVAEMEKKLDASNSQVADVSMLPYHEEVQKYMNFAVTAPEQASTGDIVWYVPMVDCDKWGLMAELDWEHWVRFARALVVLRSLELDRLSWRQKRLVRVNVIVDYAECALDRMLYYAFDKPNWEDVFGFAAQIAIGVVDQVSVVNPPQGLNLLASASMAGVVKSMLPERFRDKLRFQTGDGLKDLDYVAKVGGREQLEKLYASREGLLNHSTHYQKASREDPEDMARKMLSDAASRPGFWSGTVPQQPIHEMSDEQIRQAKVEDYQKMESNMKQLLSAAYSGAYSDNSTPSGEDAWPSKEELQLVAQLRQAFHKELAEREAQGTLHGCFFGNLALTRVLRGTGQSLELAKEWFQRFLVKMREYGVDKLVAEMEEKLNASSSQASHVSMLPYNEEVSKYMRQVPTAPKRTSAGDIVMYVPMIDSDRWGLMSQLDWNHWVCFARSMLVLRSLELERLSQKQRRIVRFNIIVDLAGCSLNSMMYGPFDRQMWQDVYQFAEQISIYTIKQTNVVNPPSVLNWMSSIANMGMFLMPSKFRNKMNFRSGDGLKETDFVEESGGSEQLRELYASRVGLLGKSKHYNAVMNSEAENGLPSEEELLLVANLREHFSAEFAAREATGRLHHCFFGDLALTRVLRGNQNDLGQATEWMERSLKWLDDSSVDVDGMVAELTPKLEASASGLGTLELMPFYEEVREYASYVHSAPKLSSTGDIIMYFPMIDYDRWGMMEHLEWDKWVRFARATVVLRCLELDRQSQEQQRMVKYHIVVDLADCSLDLLSCRSFDHAYTRDVSSFAEAVAANHLGKIIVVNPSLAISSMYTVFGILIPQKIQDKLHFQKDDGLRDESFLQLVGGREHLEGLYASRSGLVTAHGYAQRANQADQDDRLPSDRERANIAKLREEFKDQFAKREAEGRLHSCFFSDMALTRVLRGNSGDLKDSIAWLDRFFTKSEVFELDSIVATLTKNMQEAGVEVGSLSVLPHYDEVKDHFRCIWAAPRSTLKGDVIWYLPLSDLDPEKLMDSVPESSVVLFFRSLLVLRCMDVDRLSHQQGRMVKVYMIMDMEGSGINHRGLPPHPAWDIMNSTQIWPFFQEICCEVMAPCYVLNAPWIMVKSYNWFKSLIPDKFARKMNLLDGDGLYDTDFVELMGGEAQMLYLLNSRVGLLQGFTDTSEGSETISAGDVFEKRREVNPGQTVRWQFEVQAGYGDGFFGKSDLDFSVVAVWFPDFGDAALPSESQPDYELGEEVFPEQTFTPESGEISDSFEVQRAGIVMVRWSNKHSVLRSKSLSWSVEVVNTNGAATRKEKAGNVHTSSRGEAVFPSEQHPGPLSDPQ